MDHCVFKQRLADGSHRLSIVSRPKSLPALDETPSMVSSGMALPAGLLRSVSVQRVNPQVRFLG